MLHTHNNQGSSYSPTDQNQLQRSDDSHSTDTDTDTDQDQLQLSDDGSDEGSNEGCNQLKLTDIINNSSYYEILNSIFEYLPPEKRILFSQLNKPPTHASESPLQVIVADTARKLFTTKIITARPEPDSVPGTYKPPIEFLNNINYLRKYFKQAPTGVSNFLQTEYANLPEATKLEFKQSLQLWKNQITATLNLQNLDKNIMRNFLHFGWFTPSVGLLSELTFGFTIAIFSPIYLELITSALCVSLPIVGFVAGRLCALNANIKDTERALKRINYIEYLIDNVLDPSPETAQKKWDWREIINLLKIIEHHNSTGIKSIQNSINKNPEISGPEIFRLIKNTLEKRYNNTNNILSIFNKPRHPLVSELYNLFYNRNIEWDQEMDRKQVIQTLAKLIPKDNHIENKQIVLQKRYY